MLDTPIIKHHPKPRRVALADVSGCHCSAASSTSICLQTSLWAVHTCVKEAFRRYVGCEDHLLHHNDVAGVTIQLEKAIRALIVSYSSDRQSPVISGSASSAVQSWSCPTRGSDVCGIVKRHPITERYLDATLLADHVRHVSSYAVLRDVMTCLDSYLQQVFHQTTDDSRCVPVSSLLPPLNFEVSRDVDLTATLKMGVVQCTLQLVLTSVLRVLREVDISAGDCGEYSLTTSLTHLLRAKVTQCLVSLTGSRLECVTFGDNADCTVSGVSCTQYDMVRCTRVYERVQSLLLLLSWWLWLCGICPHLCRTAGGKVCPTVDYTESESSCLLDALHDLLHMLVARDTPHSLALPFLPDTGLAEATMQDSAALRSHHAAPERQGARRVSYVPPETAARSGVQGSVAVASAARRLSIANVDTDGLAGDSFAGHLLLLPAMHSKDDAAGTAVAMAAVTTMTTPSREEQLTSTVTSGRLPLERSDPFLDAPSGSLSTRATMQSVPSLIVLPHNHHDGATGTATTAAEAPCPSQHFTQSRSETAHSTEVNAPSSVRAGNRSGISNVIRKTHPASARESSRSAAAHALMSALYIDPAALRGAGVARQESTQMVNDDVVARLDAADATTVVLLHSVQLVLRLLQVMAGDTKDMPAVPLQSTSYAPALRLGIDVLVTSSVRAATRKPPGVLLTPLLDALLDWLCRIDACSGARVTADSVTATFLHAWQMQFTLLTAAMKQMQAGRGGAGATEDAGGARGAQDGDKDTVASALRWHVALLAAYLSRTTVAPVDEALHDGNMPNADADDFRTTNKVQDTSLLVLMERPFLTLVRGMHELGALKSSSASGESDMSYQHKEWTTDTPMAQCTNLLYTMQVCDALLATALPLVTRRGADALPVYLLPFVHCCHRAEGGTTMLGETTDGRDLTALLSSVLRDFCLSTMTQAVDECATVGGLPQSTIEADDASLLDMWRDMQGHAFGWPDTHCCMHDKLHCVFAHMCLVMCLRRSCALQDEATMLGMHRRDAAAAHLTLCVRLLRSAPFVPTEAATAVVAANDVELTLGETRRLYLGLHLLRCVQDDVTPSIVWPQTHSRMPSVGMLLDRALYHNSPARERRTALGAQGLAHTVPIIFDAAMAALRRFALPQEDKSTPRQRNGGGDDARHAALRQAYVEQLLRTLRALCGEAQRPVGGFFVSPHMAAALAHVLEATTSCAATLPCQGARHAMPASHGEEQAQPRCLAPALEEMGSGADNGKTVLATAGWGVGASHASTVAQSELSLPVNAPIVIPTLCLANLGPPLYFLSAGDTGAAEAMLPSLPIVGVEDHSVIPDAAAATVIGADDNADNSVAKDDSDEAGAERETQKEQEGEKKKETRSARLGSPCSMNVRSAASPADTTNLSAAPAATSELGGVQIVQSTTDCMGECDGQGASALASSRLPRQLPTRVSVELVLCLCTLVLQRGSGNIRYIFTESSLTTRTLPPAVAGGGGQHGTAGASVSPVGASWLSASMRQKLLAQAGRDAVTAMAHPSCFHVLKSLLDYLHTPAARGVTGDLVRWLHDVLDDMPVCNGPECPTGDRTRGDVSGSEKTRPPPSAAPCTALACGLYVLLRLLLLRPLWLRRFCPGKRLGAGGFGAAMAVTYSVAASPAALSADVQHDIDVAEDELLGRTENLAMKRMPYHLHGSDCGNLHFCHGEVLAMHRLALRAATQGHLFSRTSRHGQRRIATLLSYGCTGVEYFLVMPRYTGGSALAWRLAHHARGCAALGTRFTLRVAAMRDGGGGGDGSRKTREWARGAVVTHSYTLLGLCARIFRQTLEAVVYLHACNIRHSDIKAANLFIDDCVQATVQNDDQSGEDDDGTDSHEGVNKVPLCTPRPYMLPCTIRLGDFGSCDSCEWDDLDDLLCDLLADDSGDSFLAGRWGGGRGTEAVQPPEVMYAPRRYRLMRDLVSSTLAATKAQDAAAGAVVAQLHTALRRMELAVDVWGCGALLYELLTGRMLFGEDRIMRLLALATGTAQGQTPSVFTDEELHELRAATGDGVVSFLSCLLNLDPRARPTAAEALAQWSALMAVSHM